MAVYFVPNGGDFSKYFDFTHIVTLYNLDEKCLPQIRKWLEQRCQDSVVVHPTSISVHYKKKYRYDFENSSDAILFRLTWGGDR